MKQRFEERPLKYPGVQEGRYLINTNGKIILRFGDEVEPIINSKGYKTVSLTEEGSGKKTRHSVHRLVATIFIPKTAQDYLNKRDKVHFKDFDKKNTSVSNLEWVSDFELRLLSDIHKKNLSTMEELKPYVYQMICNLYTNEDILHVLHIDKFFDRLKWKKFINSIRRS